jgi:C4-dicarboxylate transporter DctM subunit
LKNSFWAILAPIIILGGIYGGIVTPTEAADISVIYSLIISIYIYKTLKWKDILRILTSAVKTTVPILFVVAAATVFGRTLTLLQAPQQIAQALIQFSSNKVILLLTKNVFLLIVGMVMDTTPAILILTPILLPVVKSFGVNPIHFGVIMVVNLAIAFVTPPVGLNLYVAHGMTGIPIMQIAKKATPFIISFFIALFLITFVPILSLAFV